MSTLPITNYMLLCVSTLWSTGQHACKQNNRIHFPYRLTTDLSIGGSDWVADRL